jgi:dipeptidyl aminopeptidase B
MAKEKYRDDETEPLTKPDSSSSPSRDSIDSATTASTASLVLEGLNDSVALNGHGKNPMPFRDDIELEPMSMSKPRDLEDGEYRYSSGRPMEKKTRWIIMILSIVCIAGWLVAFVTFFINGDYKHRSTKPHDPLATVSKGSGRKVTLDQVMSGRWRATSHEISWIAGANGEDGLLLERNGGFGDGYLVVKDVRNRKSKPDANVQKTLTLMKDGSFVVNGGMIYPSKVWPSPDLNYVLIMSEEQHNWRHSYTGKYWIFDVATQKGRPLDPRLPDARTQLASWSPQSDAVVFTRENNMFLRHLSSDDVTQITTDGGPQLFYGVPDWVYEEEVYQGNSVTWWAEDGEYIAFLRTNESTVPEYPIQYFVSRPSGKQPPPGEENYPEVREIKYPKAGAPNPVVDLQFYDITRREVFSVEISGGFADDDRLIIEVVWASAGMVLIRETNRESDIVRLLLIDVTTRKGQVVRIDDIQGLDGGWVEPTQSTKFVPADKDNSRRSDGYIDTVIHEGYDHLAYFTPLDNPDPILLTKGNWEVVDAPSAVDLKNNLVYFTSTQRGPGERHIYSVKLDGTGLTSLTDTTSLGYYSASFSTGANYALVTYVGPDIPWQKVISTPSNPTKYEDTIEENQSLARMASTHELPIKIYSTVNVDGFDLPVVERRPPHFDPKKRYPTLFFLYGGPGSQQVDRKFTVDFQSYIAANLGYLVVTVDGRGTGFVGRKSRCIIRGNIGHYESHDQIETAKIWAKKPYVDEDKMAIWGWSYGGFMTLKTLEQDGGRTFQYGMAVAPVTDWRFYGILQNSSPYFISLMMADSIYTERYMHTPDHNPSGYNNATITNTTALASTVRFLMMHGVADDNVHMQNTLTLLDKLDLAGVENYDVHVFPDSDHSIYFHNANRIVYDSKFFTYQLSTELKASADGY